MKKGVVGIVGLLAVLLWTPLLGAFQATQAAQTTPPLPPLSREFAAVDIGGVRLDVDALGGGSGHADKGVADSEVGCDSVRLALNPTTTP